MTPRTTRPLNAVAAPADRGLLADQGRRIVYVMVFRVAVVTMLLGLLIAVALLWGGPLSLDSPHTQGMFAVAVLAYVFSLGYALLYRLYRAPLWLFVGQVAVDALLVSSLVHFTGGINSVWTFLYPLLIIEAAVVDFRRGALWGALLVVPAYLGTTLAGYGQALPVLADQATLPWYATPQELGRSLLIDFSAQAAIAVLSAFLAGQLRRMVEQVAEQRETIRDIVRLNAHILKSLQSGLITLDPEGLVLSTNPAAERLLGPTLRTSSTLDLSSTLPGLLLPEEGHLEPTRLRTHLRSDDSAEGRPVDVIVTPLYGDEQQREGSILLVEDLTEIQAMEHRVKRAERLAAIGRLAAGIAHEIRNPLASVSGSLELLGSDPNASEEDRRLMQIALREVERLNGLVTNLLSYARPRPPQTLGFDLVELVQEIVIVARQDPTFSSVTLEVEAAGDTLPVVADPNQLRQVVWNLLRNGTEAMPDGGALRILVDDQDDDARIRVKDEGRGMDAETRDQIFEPFYTTKEKGTGLGLATVFRIVQDHEGRISVDSQADEGTTVTVRIPKK